MIEPPTSREPGKHRIVGAAIASTVLIAACASFGATSTAAATDKPSGSSGGTVACKPRSEIGFTLGDGIVAVPLRGWCVVSGKDGKTTLLLARGNISMIINVQHLTVDTDPQARVQAIYRSAFKRRDYIKLEVDGITDENVAANTVKGARLVWVASAHKERPKGPVVGGAVIAHVRRDGWVLDCLFSFDYSKSAKTDVALAGSTSRAVFEDFAKR